MYTDTLMINETKLMYDVRICASKCHSFSFSNLTFLLLFESYKICTLNSSSQLCDSWTENSWNSAKLHKGCDLFYQFVLYSRTIFPSLFKF